MSVKLKTNESHKFGQTNNIYPVGKIKISEEGIIEVESEEIAYEIANSEIGFSIVREGEVMKCEVVDSNIEGVKTDEEIAPSTRIAIDILQKQVDELTQSNSELEAKNKELETKLEESVSLNEELGQLLESMSAKEEAGIGFKIDEGDKTEEVKMPVVEKPTKTKKEDKVTL